MDSLDPEEIAWNIAHGLTATCAHCAGAMKDDDREFCSFACYRAHQTKEKQP